MGKQDRLKAERVRLLDTNFSFVFSVVILLKGKDA